VDPYAQRPGYPLPPERAHSHHDFWVEPGEAWFETGVDPVFAETRPDGPSHFLRVMILPRSIRGKSSITYVKPEDQDKPKTQSYQVFVDEPIELNQS